MSRPGKLHRTIYCDYCRRELEPSGKWRSDRALTRDHVMPRQAGGTRTVPCCRACNQIKGAMMPDQWRAFMLRNPGWWELYWVPPSDRRQFDLVEGADRSVRTSIKLCQEPPLCDLDIAQKSGGQRVLTRAASAAPHTREQMPTQEYWLGATEARKGKE